MQRQVVARRLIRRAVIGRLAGLGVSAAGRGVLGCSVRLQPVGPSRLPRIGVLSSEFVDASWQGALWEPVRNVGWTEGDNFAVDRRYAENHSGWFAGTADDLVRVPVDVIVTEGTPMWRAM